MSRPRVAVTMGDPAGIGPEVVVAAAPALREHADVLVVGDAAALREAARLRGTDVTVRAVTDPGDAQYEPGTLDVLDLDNVDDLEYGVVREEYGAASLAYVERAVDLAVAGTVDAMTTAPINKQATRLAGSEFAGHTGLLADRTGTEAYTMVLVGERLRVAHVTVHVPLRAVPDLVTADAVAETTRLADAACRQLGEESPTVAVAGLNPHAGDGGVIGHEDDEAVRPGVERAREAGVDAIGPVAPDTVFARAAGGDFDVVVAMYHDQGHIPFKTLDFDDDGVGGVNATVGLPIVRTSVDHGTAFDIAGEGVASERSMVEAVEVAARMARNRGLVGESANEV